MAIRAQTINSTASPTCGCQSLSIGSQGGRAGFQQVGGHGLEDAELVAEGIAQHPEVEASFLLVIPAGGAQLLQPLDLGFDGVSFDVEVHALLGSLLVVGRCSSRRISALGSRRRR